ncbi:MAG: PAS domain-containing protein [Candidatus Handelsmanbacteria bacterium]|nr:PAS domain-containing protein [Candidatus Handelsmanbacteria bacterium]
MVGALILREDTTELKSQEEQLELAIALYQNLSSIPHFVAALFDEAGNLRSISPYAQDWTGLTPEVLRARPELAWELIHPEDLPALRAACERAGTGQLVRELEFPYRGLAGDYRWAYGILCPLADPQGSIYNLQAVFQDITERKGAEEHRAQLEALHQPDVQAGSRGPAQRRGGPQLQQHPPGDHGQHRADPARRP